MVSLCIPGWPGNSLCRPGYPQTQRSTYSSLIAGVQGECRCVLLKFLLLNAAEALSFMTETSLNSFSLSLKNIKHFVKVTISHDFSASNYYLFKPFLNLWKTLARSSKIV